jgi:hypothetical protein
VDIVEEEGAAHRGQDEDDASYYAELKTRAEQALAGVRQEAYYWEKWKVKRGFFSPSFTRYKYYVRAGMPREDYEQLYRSVVREIRENRD